MAAANEDNVSIIIDAVSRARDEIQNTLKDLDRLTQANDRGSSSFNRASDAATKHENALGKVRLAGIAAVAALTIVVEKALEVGKAMIETAERVIESNAALFRAAEAAEVTAEAYGKLAFAAGLANVKQDELGVSLRRLAVAMVEAKDPASEAAQTFTQLGISTKGLENRKPTEVLLEMANAFATHTGVTNKAAIAQTLLGRGSREMVGFLNQGTEAIRAQGLEGQRLGAVISNEAAAAAEEFSQKMDVLKATVNGFISQAITPALPVLQAYADQLLEVARDKQTVVNASAALITIFSTLAQIATGVYVVFKTLGIVLGQGVALAFGIVEKEITGTIRLFNVLGQGAARLLTTFVDLAGTLSGLGDAFSRLLMGDFSGAAESASNTFSEFGAKAVELGKQFTEVFSEAAKTVESTATSIVGDVTDITKGAVDDIGKTVDAAGKVFKALEDGKAAIGSASPTSSAAGRAEKAGATGFGDRSNPAENAKRELNALKALGESKTQLVAADIAKEEALNEQKYQARLINDADYLAKVEALQQQKLENEKRAALEAIEFEHTQRLLDIEDLRVSLEEKQRLRDEDNATYNNKIAAVAIEGNAKQVQAAAAAKEREKAVLNQRIQGTRNAFELMADAASTFGKQGFIAFRIAASAAALVATYQNATQAYGAVVGIPYVGPALAVAAAAAAVVAGLANVAKINSISFAEGGIVPGAPSAVDNRVANVATGEMIISAGSTQSLISAVGMGGIQRLLAGQVPMFGFESGPSLRPRSSNTFATGGLVGAGTTQTSPVDAVDVSVGFLNGRNAMREFLEKQGTAILIDQMSRRGNAVVA